MAICLCCVDTVCIWRPALEPFTHKLILVMKCFKVLGSIHIALNVRDRNRMNKQNDMPIVNKQFSYPPAQQKIVHNFKCKHSSQTTFFYQLSPIGWSETSCQWRTPFSEPLYNVSSCLNPVPFVNECSLDITVIAYSLPPFMPAAIETVIYPFMPTLRHHSYGSQMMTASAISWIHSTGSLGVSLISLHNCKTKNPKRWPLRIAIWWRTGWKW